MNRSICRFHREVPYNYCSQQNSDSLTSKLTALYQDFKSIQIEIRRRLQTMTRLPSATSMTWSEDKLANICRFKVINHKKATYCCSQNKRALIDSVLTSANAE